MSPRNLRPIARVLGIALVLGVGVSIQTGGLHPKTVAAGGSLQLPWPAGTTYNPGISQYGCSYDCPPGHLGNDYYAIDWNLGSGNQVAAVLGGTVHFTTDSCGGTILWIDHGSGLISYYAHLGSYASGLRDGDAVTAGQTIAYSDDTGSCTSGAHLHFSMHSGATSWNNGSAYMPEPMAAPNGGTYTGFGSCGASSNLHSNAVNCGPYTSTAAPVSTFNLLSNSSFETGSISPWVSGPAYQVISDPSSAMESSKYLEVTPVNVNDTVYQDVGTALQPGQNYTVSIWLRSRDGTPISGQLVLWGLWGNLINASTNFTAGSAWISVSVGLPITVSGDNVLRSQLYISTTGHNLDIDGAQLLANMLGNASFETGALSPWTTGVSYSVVSDSTYAMEGSKYLEVNPVNVNDTVYQDVSGPQQIGQSYAFSIWVRSKDGALISGQLVLWSLWGTYKSASTNFTAGSGWTSVAVGLPITVAGNNVLRSQIYLQTTGHSLDLDGAQLVNAGLGNASFELATPDPWTAFGAGTTLNTYQNAGYALESSGYGEMSVSQSGGSVVQDTSIIPQANTSYTFTIWLRSRSNFQFPTGSVAIWAMGNGNPGGGTNFIVSGLAWTRVSASVTPPPGTYQWLRVQIYSTSPGLYLDMDGATLASGNRV